MASITLRRRKFWVQYFVPGEPKPRRETLGTGEPALAALMKEKLECLLALGHPRLAGVELPANIFETLPVVSMAISPPPPAVETKGVSITDALSAYYLHIKESNHPRWVSAKLKTLSALFSTKLVASATGVDFGRCEQEKGAFRGKYLEEIPSILLETVVASRKGRDGETPAAEKTKRHYREVFHDFFEYCLSHNLMKVENFHTPNPVAALPSYLDTNRRIVFLDETQIGQQYAALEGIPTLAAATRIMIELGLRRSEALWLTKDAFTPDFSMVSIVTRFDPEHDVSSSLKTAGSHRSVPLSDSLREFLPGYLANLPGVWVLPSPKGKRWDADNFSASLRRANEKAALPWTCGHYRHTFATRKAFLERWSSVRIARVMGTSVAMIDKHYAGYLHPDV